MDRIVHKKQFFFRNYITIRCANSKPKTSQLIFIYMHNPPVSPWGTNFAHHRTCKSSADVVWLS